SHWHGLKLYSQGSSSGLQLLQGAGTDAANVSAVSMLILRGSSPRSLQEKSASPKPPSGRQALWGVVLPALPHAGSEPLCMQAAATQRCRVLRCWSSGRTGGGASRPVSGPPGGSLPNGRRRRSEYGESPPAKRRRCRLALGSNSLRVSARVMSGRFRGTTT